LKSGSRKVNRFLIIISAYLLVIFIVSAVISSRQINNKDIKPEELCAFARQFLKDSELIEIGKKLDCSGFTQLVFKKYGYTLPRSSIQQFKRFAVNENILKPGDLVFFSSDKKQVGHVGIYLKNNTFIHSPGENQEVRLDNLSDKYWKKHYTGSGSVIKLKN
jgi:cell wall-associated NlpC family hydrolase